MRSPAILRLLAAFAAITPSLVAQNNSPDPAGNPPPNNPAGNPVPPPASPPPTPAPPPAPPPAIREHDARALERLGAMSQAFKTAKSLSLTIKCTSAGMFFVHNPRFELRTIMLRPAGDASRWLTLWTGSSTQGEAVTPIVILDDGLRRYWVDQKTRTATERSIANAQKMTDSPENTAITMGTPKELMAADPVAEFLQADTIKWESAGELDGTPVDVIKIDPGRDRIKTRLWVSSKDGIPRKIDRLYEGQGTQTFLFSNVQVNPPLREEQFRIDVPDGWNISRETEGPLKYFNATRHVPDAPVARPGGPEIGQIAPDFELKGADGKAVKLSEQRGKVVLLDFWGTWSLPSLKSRAEVQALHEKFKDQPVRVLGLVAREADAEAPVKIMKERGSTYALLLKADDVAKAYRIRRFPSFFVIGFDGEVVHAAAEYKPDQTLAEITKKIEAYLQAREGKGQTPGDAGANLLQDK